MDEGRNVCLLFPEGIEVGESEGEFERVKKCFEASYVSLAPKILVIGGKGGADGAGRSHIFYSRRVVDIADGKPKWAGMDEESELLDDGGYPMVEA